MQPFFSIIIPCYNSENTIIRTLKSIVDQSFKDYEIIIVDDGSTDNTRKVIETYCNKSMISYQYFFQENQGPSVARNLAVKNSFGKYLAFLDSDDEWYYRKLEIQSNYILNYSSKFLSCKFTLNNYSTKVDNINYKYYSFNEFLLSNRTSTPCTIIEKELFTSLGGFDESLRYSEDYNLWLKASLSEKLLFLNISLVKLYKKPYGEGGLSADLWSMEKGELYNYSYLYEKKIINFLQYYSISFFSLCKFTYRYIISNYKRLVK